MILEENFKIDFEMITDYWKDTGTPNDIIHANGEVLKNMKSYNFSDVDKTTTFTGNVMIGKNSKIFGNSEIIGPCIIAVSYTHLTLPTKA